MRERIVKVVVAGPFGSGKTTFVNSASTSHVMTSESDVTDTTQALKSNTTVAMDHGLVENIGDGFTVSLFGTPGQERFTFMWPIIAQGLDAYVMLVDASRLQATAQLKRVVRYFAEIAPGVPYVVAANRWNREEVSPESLAAFVGVPVEALVECDPRNAEECRQLLTEIVGIVVSRWAAEDHLAVGTP